MKNWQDDIQISLGTSVVSGADFSLSGDDLTRHLFIGGLPGAGKTTMLENMAQQFVEQGVGFAFFDPNGDAYQRIAASIPRELHHKVILIDPSDVSYPIAWNILAGVPHEQKPSATERILDTLRSIFPKAWGQRMNRFLKFTYRALLDLPESNILDIADLLTEDTFREYVIPHMSDGVVRKFWEKQFPQFSKQRRQEFVDPVLNKIELLTDSPIVRNMFCQVDNKLNFRKIIDEGYIVLINLSVGSLGLEQSRIIGSLLYNEFYTAALSREDQLEEQRVPFAMLLDEFHNVTPATLPHALATARKYRLLLVLAAQYLDQVEPDIEDALFGAVGNHVVFRVCSEDAEVFADNYGRANEGDNHFRHDRARRIMEPEQISTQDFGEAYVRRSFSKLPDQLETHPPMIQIAEREALKYAIGKSNFHRLRDKSRMRYARPRKKVEAHVDQFMARRAKLVANGQRPTALRHTSQSRCKKVSTKK